MKDGAHLAALAGVAFLATIVPAQATLSDWPVQRTDAALEGDFGTPEPRWQFAYGGVGDDYAYDVWPAGDGGYVAVGRTTDPTNGNVDAFILKVDADGAPVWSKRWGGSALDIAFGVRTLADGEIVVGGWTKSFGAGEGDFFLLGLERTGEVRFERTFGTAKDERATQILATQDGGILLIGESYGFGPDSRFYAVKTDARGDLEWERSYDAGPLHDRGLAAAEHDGGYILAGNSMNSTSGSTATVSNGLIVAIDRYGSERWRRSFGSDSRDIFHHVTMLRDGKFLVTGYTRGFGAGDDPDLWALAIDADGEQKFAKTIGGPGADHNIVARPWGTGAALAGYTKSFGGGEWNVQIVRLGANGRLVWSHVYCGDADDGATSVVPQNDGTLGVAGYTKSFGAGGEDVLLMRLAPKKKRS